EWRFNGAARGAQGAAAAALSRPRRRRFRRLGGGARTTGPSRSPSETVPGFRQGHRQRRRGPPRTGGRPVGPPAARLPDMHVCPMVTAVVPHVGGPIAGPGCPKVLIGGMPAARVSDMCVCVGPPDVIALGSFTVLIGGLPAARMGDMTAHG